MTARQPRYSKEEFARRCDEIYNRDIRPLVEADNQGKYVAIDIETGTWEMDADELPACDRAPSVSLSGRADLDGVLCTRVPTPHIADQPGD